MKNRYRKTSACDLYQKKFNFSIEKRFLLPASDNIFLIVPKCHSFKNATEHEKPWQVTYWIEKSQRTDSQCRCQLGFALLEKMAVCLKENLSRWTWPQKAI